MNSFLMFIVLCPNRLFTFVLFTFYDSYPIMVVVRKFIKLSEPFEKKKCSCHLEKLKLTQVPNRESPCIWN